MTSAGVLAASLCLALGAVALARREPLLRAGLVLLYTAWHLPLFISLLFPYRTTYEVPITNHVVIGLLAATHGTAYALVLGYRTAGRKGGVAKSVDPPRFVLWIAWISPALLLVDLILLRATHLTLDLAANRSASAGSKTLPGQVGSVASGFALYLLLFAFQAAPRRPILRRQYLLPFLAVSAISLISGNRQFVFFGLLLTFLALVRARSLSLRRVLRWSPAVLIPLVLLGLAFTMARQSATAGRQDLFIESIGSISVDPTAPRLVTDSYAVRTSTLALFLYYGTEYSVAARLWERFRPMAPHGAMTVPALYRRWSGALGEPDQTTVDDAVHAEMASALGVFYPRIWPTMYSNVLFEWGRRGVVMFVGLVWAIAFLVARRYGRRGYPDPLMVFLASATFGLMYLATYEVPVVGLCLAAVAVALRNRASNVAVGARSALPTTSPGVFDQQ